VEDDLGCVASDTITTQDCCVDLGPNLTIAECKAEPFSNPVINWSSPGYMCDGDLILVEIGITLLNSSNESVFLNYEGNCTTNIEVLDNGTLQYNGVNTPTGVSLIGGTQVLTDNVIEIFPQSYVGLKYTVEVFHTEDFAITHTFTLDENNPACDYSLQCQNIIPCLVPKNTKKDLISASENESLDFLVYPNPIGNMEGNLKVKLSNTDLTTPVKVFIYNQVGELVQESILNSDFEINVDDLSSGIYTMRLSNGIEQSSKLFIKE